MGARLLAGVWAATYSVCGPRGDPHLPFLRQVGNYFFRRLRGGKPPGARIRAFTERNLFASAEDVDDEWVANCVAGSRDAGGRYATFSYLCGSIPAGGAWRDDRGALFDSLHVPLQLLRGDYGGLQNGTARAEQILARAPRPSRACSAIIGGARACVPYERAPQTARMLARFLEREFGAEAAAPAPAELELGFSFTSEREVKLLG